MRKHISFDLVVLADVGDYGTFKTVVTFCAVVGEEKVRSERVKQRFVHRLPFDVYFSHVLSIVHEFS